MKAFFEPGIRQVHLIGIGGISMSAIAKILHKYGYQVSGSDCQDGPTIKELIGLGIHIDLKHSAENVQGKDLIIYTSAIHEDNPELAAAKALGLPTISRGLFFGLLTSQFKDSIAVAGNHGKTTTTAMAGVMLQATNLDPVILVGAHVPELGGNTVVGQGECIVNEACEYYRNFLDFHYNICVILNIDEDHLDYFKDMADIQATFLDFAQNTRPDGVVILNADDPEAFRLAEHIPQRKIFVSREREADYCVRNVDYDEDGCAVFEVIAYGEKLCDLHLSIPGEHNITDALAALAAVRQVCPELNCLSALESFRGAERRLEKKGQFQGAVLIEDYAHHPTEIKVALAALRRMYPKKRLVVGFQPHTYTRTLKLFDKFRSAFADADEVDFVDIYSAREQDVYGISARDLSQAVDATTHNGGYFGSMERLGRHLRSTLKDGDVFIAMGAGDIYKIFAQLK